MISSQRATQITVGIRSLVIIINVSIHYYILYLLKTLSTSNAFCVWLWCLYAGLVSMGGEMSMVASGSSILLLPAELAALLGAPPALKLNQVKSHATFEWGLLWNYNLQSFFMVQNEQMKTSTQHFIRVPHLASPHALLFTTLPKFPNKFGFTYNMLVRHDPLAI